MLKTAFLILIFLFATCISFAQWSTDPANNLIVGYGITPEVASDGAGGCYITYIQQVGIYDRVWLERLNRYGYKPWGTRRQIIGVLPGQTFAKIAEDGLGGVIVSFWDVLLVSPHEPPIVRLRVQRVDSSGNFLWGPTGVRVSVSETNQGDQAIVSDGEGGCVVVWKDTLSTIRVQRVDNTGGRVWGDSGLFLTFSSEKVLLSHSNSVGVTALYYTNREFRSQRINLSGQLLWGNGIRIPTGARVMRSDDQGYIYFFGGKSLGIQNGQALFTLNLVKTDTSGALLWDSLGVTLDTLNTNRFISMDFSLQNGFTTLCWEQQFASQWDLRTQIVRSDGSTVFPYGGIAVSRASSGKGLVGVLPSDSMSSLFIWGDSRTTGGMYAQRLDTLGQALWDTNDVPLNLPEFGEMLVTSDGRDGCIGVGFHQFDFSIRALQVNKYGDLGQVLTAVEDKNSHDLPQQPILYQNYPNPFNPQTTIRFQLPQVTYIVLTLYNILGQSVRTLASGLRDAGVHSVVLDAHDLPSGMYLYRLTTPEAVLTHKLLIIK